MTGRFLWAAASLPQETVPAAAPRPLRKVMELTKAINMTKITGTAPLITIVLSKLKKKKTSFLRLNIKMYKTKNRKKAFFSLSDHLMSEAHTFYLKFLAQSHLSHSSEKVEMEGWKGR